MSQPWHNSPVILRCLRKCRGQLENVLDIYSSMDLDSWLLCISENENEGVSITHLCTHYRLLLAELNAEIARWIPHA